MVRDRRGVVNSWKREPEDHVFTFEPDTFTNFHTHMVATLSRWLASAYQRHQPYVARSGNHYDCKALRNYPSVKFCLCDGRDWRATVTCMVNGEKQDVMLYLPPTRFVLEKQEDYVAQACKAEASEEVTLNGEKVLRTVKVDGENINRVLAHGHPTIGIWGREGRDGKGWHRVGRVRQDGTAEIKASAIYVRTFMHLLNRNGDPGLKSIGRMAEACLMCGSPLTKPESKERGLGPRCERVLLGDEPPQEDSGDGFQVADDARGRESLADFIVDDDVIVFESGDEGGDTEGDDSEGEDTEGAEWSGLVRARRGAKRTRYRGSSGGSDGSSDGSSSSDSNSDASWDSDEQAEIDRREEAAEAAEAAAHDWDSEDDTLEDGQDSERDDGLPAGELRRGQKGKQKDLAKGKFEAADAGSGGLIENAEFVEGEAREEFTEWRSRRVARLPEHVRHLKVDVILIDGSRREGVPAWLLPLRQALEEDFRFHGDETPCPVSPFVMDFALTYVTWWETDANKDAWIQSAVLHAAGAKAEEDFLALCVELCAGLDHLGFGDDDEFNITGDVLDLLLRILRSWDFRKVIAATGCSREGGWQLPSDLAPPVMRDLEVMWKRVREEGKLVDAQRRKAAAAARRAEKAAEKRREKEAAAERKRAAAASRKAGKAAQKDPERRKRKAAAEEKRKKGPLKAEEEGPSSRKKRRAK
jgi:hypothetical protein